MEEKEDRRHLLVQMEKEEMEEEEEKKEEKKKDVKEREEPQQLDSRQLVELYKARMIDQLHQEVGGGGSCGGGGDCGGGCGVVVGGGKIRK